MRILFHLIISSTTFHSAGYIHKRCSTPSYLLDRFTAASRINSKKHDILDVLAGAVIGFGSNLLFTTEYQQEHMELIFVSDSNGYLIEFRHEF